jgi:hypothetical protein
MVSSQRQSREKALQNQIKRKEQAMQKPSLTIGECVQILRDNNISKTEKVLGAQIQAGLFTSWAIPSVGTKEPCPDISRAGFMAWVKDFYKLEKVYTKEEPRE